MQLAATGILGGLAASQQMQAGKIAAIESETEAQQIETAAAQREADRKERLASAIASQSAELGARGITSIGSPLSVIEEDIQREERATERDLFMSRIGAGASRARGKAAKAQARAQATLGLLTTGVSAARTGLPARATATTLPSAADIGRSGF